MDRLCTVSQIAEWAGVTRGVVAGWIRHRGLHVRQRIGTRKFLCKSDVTKFLDRQNYLAAS
ncbi:MAG: helix-turn-helix domain-containing protein [Planctomycetes bacterium]|nr:helix-turn-helix domain-containing protein [Planctomycetota bacterium]